MCIRDRAGLWPNNNGMNIVLDLGANIECDENNLIEFAEMGAALHKSLFPSEEQKVALLNIGSEEIKGTETIKKAYSDLKSISQKGDFVFNGYIEGNKITEGLSNIIVTCLLYTSPSPRDVEESRMPSSA